MFSHRWKQWACIAAAALTLSVFEARTAYAMHIMEGFLPLTWCLVWFAVALPFWIAGFQRIKRLVAEQPEMRLLLGLAGAFMFVLSALKIPSITGSSSHPTRFSPIRLC